jgi:hypothetical protein
VIGRRGTQDDQIDIGRLDTCRRQCTAGGLLRQIAGRFTGGSDVTLLNTGTLDDPFGGGVDHLFEIGVSEHFFRQIAAGSSDPGVVQRACLSA